MKPTFKRIKCRNGYGLVWGTSTEWSVLDVPLSGTRQEQAQQLRAARRRFWDRVRSTGADHLEKAHVGGG